MIRGFYSQLNNLSAFRNIFSLRQVLTYMQGFPLTINLLITAKCNLSCSICSAKGLGKDEIELSGEQIIAFIEKIAKFRPAIFIGGGEPFLKKDIFDVLGAITKHKLKCGIVTNGTSLNSDYLERILLVEPDVLMFSIYGKEERHEAITGVKGSFNSIIKAIRFFIAKRKKTKVLLNSVINENNYLYMEEVAQLGKELGVDQVRFEHLVFISNKEYKHHLEVCKSKFSDNEDEYFLTTHLQEMNNPEIGDVLKNKIPYLAGKYGKFVLFKPYLENNELLLWYSNDFNFNRRCLFVRHSVFIKPNGDIIPCQFFSNYILGNIVKDDISRVWIGKRRKSFLSIMSQRLLPGCNRCCKL